MRVTGAAVGTIFTISVNLCHIPGGASNTLRIAVEGKPLVGSCCEVAVVTDDVNDSPV